MNEQENIKPQEDTQEITDDSVQETAQKFLSDALKASFILLQIIMIVIALIFAVSGWEEVHANEKGLVLRFGKIKGLGENRILQPGGHWVWPYPIEELVRIPYEKNITLKLNDLWYRERSLPSSSGQTRRFAGGETLNPLVDGYSLARSQQQQLTGSSESDYNIVHTKWQMQYRIEDAELFFKNVYIDWESIEPGQNYADVITKNIEHMLKDAFADSVVSTLVNFTIDEILYEKIGTITDKVKRQLQAKLDSIQCGIEVSSVQMIDKAPPPQTNEAFQALMKARQTREAKISQANSEADKTMNEAKAQSAQKIANAKAIRRQIVETAQANANAFKKLLPEYRKLPKLVALERYRRTIRNILDNVDEKMIIQPSQSSKGSEIRIELNRDPTIKNKKKEESENKQ